MVTIISDRLYPRLCYNKPSLTKYYSGSNNTPKVFKMLLLLCPV